MEELIWEPIEKKLLLYVQGNSFTLVLAEEPQVTTRSLVLSSLINFLFINLSTPENLTSYAPLALVTVS